MQPLSKQAHAAVEQAISKQPLSRRKQPFSTRTWPLSGWYFPSGHRMQALITASFTAL